MNPDAAVLAEKVAAVERHLRRVADLLPDRPGLGSPASYAEAFRKLSSAGTIDTGLSERLTRAAGFRNVVAHAYQGLDMARVHSSAKQGPADLRAFLAAMATLAAARQR